MKKGRGPPSTPETGKPITTRQIAGLLKPFKIISVNVGPKNSRAKGYRRADFIEAWDRYLPASGPADSAAQDDEVSPQDDETVLSGRGLQILPSTRTRPTAAGTSDVFSSVHQGAVNGNENGKKPNNHGPVYGWTEILPNLPRKKEKTGVPPRVSVLSAGLPTNRCTKGTAHCCTTFARLSICASSGGRRPVRRRGPTRPRKAQEDPDDQWF